MGRTKKRGTIRRANDRAKRRGTRRRRESRRSAKRRGTKRGGVRIPRIPFPSLGKKKKKTPSVPHNSPNPAGRDASDIFDILKDRTYQEAIELINSQPENVFSQRDENRTILHHLVRNIGHLNERNFEEVVKEIMKKEQYVKEIINEPDNDGKTALQLLVDDMAYDTKIHANKNYRHVLGKALGKVDGANIPTEARVKPSEHIKDKFDAYITYITPTPPPPKPTKAARYTKTKKTEAAATAAKKAEETGKTSRSNSPTGDGSNSSEEAARAAREKSNTQVNPDDVNVSLS